MRNARQTGLQRYPSSVIEDEELLDENAVLEQLEADFCNGDPGSDEDYRRIIGIRNGMLAGALLWAVLIASALTVL